LGAHTKNVLGLFTPKEALSLFIEARMTKIQYIIFRSQAKNEEFTSTQVTAQLKLLKTNFILLTITVCVKRKKTNKMQQFDVYY